MSSYSLVTGPSVEPLDLTTVKNYLRVDASDDDTLITGLIVAARQWVENSTWRPLCTQTWRYSLDYNEFRYFIGISKAPVQSIDSITYVDVNDVSRTMTTGVDYQQDLYNEPARIKFLNKPDMKDQMNAMIIIFTCGYGAAAAVPQAIKDAMMMLIAHWYEHRESVVVGVVSNNLEASTNMILEGYRLDWFYPYLN